ncbi:hypothetical protein H6G03_29580 [Planktothrix sp. FACHB-1375]|uniref:Uncharacterized protein n=1 Tax=Aerosakkonema funiforme FACHB-1375 TaxID=2949571 RepID=A0A926VJS6_9CYAN|nr:hypothetical protein [Aerosakkonema funiforme FACHB-1375]
MYAKAHWHPISIESLTGQIMVSGQMTRTDRYQIRSALLTDSLSESEQILINRLLYGIRHGLLRVVD